MVAILGVDLDVKSFMNKLYKNPPEGEHGMMILSDATGAFEYWLDNPMGEKLENKGIVLRDSAEKVRQVGKTDNEMLSYKWGMKTVLPVSNHQQALHVSVDRHWGGLDGRGRAVQCCSSAE